MKVAFIGDQDGFNYESIGGVENYMRRLAFDLVSLGCSIDMFFLNAKKQSITKVSDQIILHYEIANSHTIDKVLTDFDVVLPVYLSFFSRLVFLFKVIIGNKRGIIVKILFNWQDNGIKRFIYFFEAMVMAGTIICLSNRQFKYLDRLSYLGKIKPSVVPPPVPNSYFESEVDKLESFRSDSIEVVFVGRLDFGKGIDEVITIMESLSDDPRYRCSIYGIFFPQDLYGRKIHEELTNQNSISYFPIERSNFSEKLEYETGNILKKAHIFLQPYKKISSTVDAPLLIYEAMAALCLVVSRNIGDLQVIVGSDEYLLDDLPEKDFIYQAVQKIKSIDKMAFRDEVRRVSQMNTAFKDIRVADTIIEGF